jgi:iron(III) transport system substrate-binding protein
MGTALVASQVSCSRRTTSQTKSINLYSARHYNTDAQLYAGFTQETGIKVNLVEGNADALLERIKSEGANTQADIFITVDIGRLWRAQESGIFAPVTSKVLEEKIPAYLRHPQGLWFGFSKRARVIIYNKGRIQASQLSTYEDLANPNWKGKIVMRSSSNLYNQSLVASLIVADGEAKTEQWCRGLVANFKQPPQGNDTTQIESVASGLADLTLANTYYLAAYGKSEDPARKAIFEQVKVFFPNQKDRGAHINISGAGVVKNAPNQEAAIQFLEYLISPTAQKFFADGNNEYPVLEDLPLSPVLQSFGTFKPDLSDVAAFGPNLATAVKIMDRAGWK